MEEESLTFEEAFKELEGIVSKLEAGELALGDSLALFERGMLLAQYCEKQLDQAELKVSELIVGEGGEVDLRPFPAESSD